MKRRFHDSLLGIVGLAGVAFFALSGASCEKTEMQCAVGHGPFIVTYAVTSGDAACYPGGTAEEIGFSTYLQSRAKTNTDVTYHVDDDKDPATPSDNDDGDDTTLVDVPKKYTVVSSAGADYNTRKIAIQSTTMGNFMRGRLGKGLKSTSVAYAFGDYTSNPDDANVCFAGGGAVGALANADLDVEAFPTVDEMDMPITLPAFHYTQEWKNVRLYVTEGVPGTQAVGEMTFENKTPGEACTVSFKFIGLYPAAHCIAEILMDRQVDDDEDPATPSDNDDADPATMDEIVIGDFVREEADNDLCLAAAEEGWKKPAAGIEYKPARVYGSGINPDFKTHCDADLGYCVLDDNTALVE